MFYHGAPSQNLKKLIFTEELSRFGCDERMLHGAGIYLTTSWIEADAYAMGGSVYSINVKGEIFDTTDYVDMLSFVKSIEEDLKINLLISESPSFISLMDSTIRGESSGVFFYKNLINIISNDESLYFSIICDIFDSDCDKFSDYIVNRFLYKNFKINNISSCTWLICKDFKGDSLEILNEENVKD